MWIFCRTLKLKMVGQSSEDFSNKESHQTMEQLLRSIFLISLWAYTYSFSQFHPKKLRNWCIVTKISDISLTDLR